jgi:APA family basic amino acid/polyamine antiporter
MSNEKAKLLKSFGLNMAIILVVSNIIGSGVFKKVAPMSAGLLSPNLVILAWVLAGLVTLFGVLTVAEAGTMFPHSGGAYSWLEKMYGKTVSFFYGWSCFTVIQTAAIASIAFVFAGAVGNFIDLPNISDGSEKIKAKYVFVQHDSLYAELECGHHVFLTNAKDTLSAITHSYDPTTSANQHYQVDTSYFKNDSLVVGITPTVILGPTGDQAPPPPPQQMVISQQHSPHGLAAFSILGGAIKPLSNIGAKCVAALLIIILTLVNIKGAKYGGRISQVFTWIIITCIIMIIIAGLSSAVGAFTNLTTASNTYDPPTIFKNGFGWQIGLVIAMVIAMRNAFWGYEGWISLGYVGAEIQNPGRNVPRALIIGIFIVIAAYVLLNVTYLYVMPIDELLFEVRKNENTIAAVIVMNKIFGSWGGYIISAMILVSTLGCTNTTVLTASRIYYAMAQKGLFFKKAAVCHPKNNTPNNSLIYQCIWACILVFSGSFDMLTDLLIFAAFIFYGMIVFGVIILRFKMKNTPRPYKTIGYPVVPILFVIFCVMLVVISIIEMPYESLIGFGLILSGLPFYLIWYKRSKNMAVTAEEV